MKQKHAVLRGPTRLLLVVCVALSLQLADLRSQGGSSARATVTTRSGAEAARGEALVQFRDRPTATLRSGPLAQYVDADESTTVGRRGLHRFRSRSFDVDALVAFLRSQPDVVYAEPNYVVRAIATPNDQYFPLLWGLYNAGQTVNGMAGLAGADISATDAWNLSTGSRNVVVGVIDTGVAHGHPDLAANMWSAPAPFSVVIGGVTINCPAGSHGFNAITNACNPQDDHYHGTHVAGTLGATGNNGIGIAGVNWITSVIGAKFLAANGQGFTDDAVESIEFLIQTKAAFAGTSGANIRVLNNSWGGTDFSQALSDEIVLARASDMLFVAAAGNTGTNNDGLPFYPANYALDNVLAVAATDNRDNLASFSNRGVATVHLAAPGVNIGSTIPGGYAYLSGTSMAAPHVSGAAALVLSRCALTTTALRQNLLDTVDALGSLVGMVSSSGRLNVDRALRACAGPLAPSAPTGVVAIPGDGRVSLAWNPVAGATSYRVKRSGTSGGPYTTVAPNVAGTNYLDTGLTNNVPYFYVVTAVNDAGESPASAQVSATPNVTKPLPPANLTALPGDGKVTLTWPASAGATSYNVLRSLVSGGPFAPIVNVATTSYVDTNVSNGTTYFYVVTAANEAGASNPSKKVSATPAPVPLPPTGLTASPGASPGLVNLSWNASTWATGYKVKRATVSGGPYATRKVSTTSVTDTVTSGRRYYYAVTALNGTGESTDSIEVTIVGP